MSTVETILKLLEIARPTSEEEAKALIRARGLEPTRELIDQFIQIITKAKKSLKTVRAQWSLTHHFPDISFPTIKERDLVFTVPEGTHLQKTPRGMIPLQNTVQRGLPLLR